MKTTPFILTSLLALSSFPLWSGVEYYGKNSTEAELKFEGRVLFEYGRTMTLESLKNTTALNERVTELVDYQLTHMIGHFKSESYLTNTDLPAVMGENYKFKFSKVEKVDDKLFAISYKFDGMINVHKKAFAKKPTSSIAIRLPLNPLTIYQNSMKGSKNPCTDKDYNSEGDFFYFWDPELPGCSLKDKNEHLILSTKGAITQYENTTLTYPEFDRLYTKPKMKAVVFVGYIEHPKTSTAALKDIGYETYVDLKKRFKNEFKFDLLVEDKDGIAFESTFTKTITNGLGNEMEVELSMILDETDLGASDFFASKYTDALSDADLIVYDGHSGLGGNLNLDYLPKVQWKRNYQIFFFNGCSTYPYFNQTYFASKPGGSKNLEIITSGLETLAATSGDNVLAFLRPFVFGRVLSYQKLMDQMELTVTWSDTYLYGVNGDEDNTFKP